MGQVPPRRVLCSLSMSSQPQRTILACLALGLLAGACGRGSSETAPPGPSAWPLQIQPASPPGVGEGVAPQLTASGKGVVLSWIERGDSSSTLRFSERAAGSWTEPRTVTKGSNWFVSWADAPSVLRLGNGTLLANWFVTTREEIEAYNLHMSYSKDDGRTWAPEFMPHRDNTQTQHGFATPFETPDGGLGLVWLDGRDMSNNTTDPEGGVMTLRYTSFDPSWKQAADVEINRRVCECCQTAAVVTPDGIVAAFRDRSEKEIRDIMVSRLEGGRWSAPQTVHADNWEIDLCPVNGPALSARGRELAAAWFNAKGDEGHAFAAFSSDAGRSWSAPIRLDDSLSVGHVDIEMLDDGSAAATWVEFAGERQRFMVRRVNKDGTKSVAVLIAGDGAGRMSGYPRLAKHESDLIFAWSESGGGNQGTATVKAAVAKVPR
jgi:hypothetical protein